MCVENQGNSGEQSASVEKNGCSTPTLVYPSWIMRNALASLINLVTLLIGIALGIMLAPHLEKSAQAFSRNPQQTTSQAPPSAAQGSSSSSAPGEPTVEPIQPVMTAGSIGSYLFLAHHIQSDELVVNGYDMMKLQNAELQLISRLVPAFEVQAAVNQAKSDHLYQIKQPTQKTPASPSQKK